MGTLIATLASASLVVWIVPIARLRAGQPILPAEPRQAEGALDLYIAFSLYLLVLWAYAKATEDPAAVAKSDAFDLESLTTYSLLSLSATGLALGYLALRPGPRFVFGLLASRPRTDVVFGLLTFLAALVPIFSIQYVLTQFFPSRHPVQLLLTKDASPQVVALCALSVVIVAPLTEEFVFRVLLQGWMETIVLWWRSREQLLPAGELPIEHAPAASSPELMPLPILLSSLAFALVHLGHGPDPIPLFVFALMLGYLYQKTHRIWPSLVVHACLNAWSLTMLWLNLKLGLGE